MKREYVMLTVEFQRKALAAAFGTLQTDETPEGRAMLSAKGYILNGDERVQLCVIADSKEEAVHKLFHMVADKAVKRPRRNYPPVVEKESSVFADDGARIVYRKRDHQLLRR